MDNQIISVIVPVFNVADDLPRCLDSILAQTHCNLEIIAVDDGSSDGSRSVLEAYAARDGRVKLIFKENGGVTSARLRGIEEATGEWIGFVDGDDEIEPDMYDRLLRNAVKYRADISHCGYQMRFADGRVNYFHNTGRLEQHDRVRGVRELLSGALVEPGLCNKLYRRELFAGIEGRLDKNIRINEDLLMNYYLFKAAKGSVFDDWCPYHYIVRSSSASRANWNDHKIYDPIRVKEIILEDAPEELLPNARRALTNTCVYSYCAMVGSREPEVREARKVLRGKLKEHHDWCRLLPGRTKLLAALIVKVPGIFALAYPVYIRFFQKRKYS